MAFKKLITLKRRALIKFRCTQLDWQRYKVLRNDVTCVIRREKKSFLCSCLFSNSSRQFWRNLLTLGETRSSSITVPVHLLDPSLLNNYFVDFLLTVFNDIIDHLPFFSRDFPERFNFTSINFNQLYNIFKYIRFPSIGPLRLYDFTLFSSLILCSTF
ncbi:hypothetical protein ALC56_07130 [Trachymyrmex septentrionalis]|uniref:Uncharacterized protein n=1 Tax=Trachymyrmex septentrionalis TaxID=34720 RepID=A0A151JWV5_9HYME|nr:hypothetical protein ALC56_07130 [Trachymyrmex septentrionalis]